MDLLRLLPSFIRRHLSDSPNRQEIVANSGWLVSDKILRLVVGLFVSVLVARYLGPGRFGLLSYAIAFASLFGVLAGLGLENIVIRELVKRPWDQQRLLGTAFFLQFAAGILTWGIVIAVVALLPHGVDGTFWLVFIVAISFVFQSVKIVEFHFRSRVEARYIVLGKVVPFLLISAFKVALVLSEAGVAAFAAAFTLEAALEAIGLVVIYRLRGQKPAGLRFDRDIALRTLSESWPLLLSGLSIMVYMRIDQIMLGQMSGIEEVGLYAAAVRISEVWYFIPTFLAQSAFPIIVQSRGEDQTLYNRRLQDLFSLTCVFSYFMILPLVLFSHVIIVALFGPAYAASGKVVAMHVWGGLFVSLGVVQSTWLVNEGLTRLSLFRTLLGAIANVILNLLLIPVFGIMGAAVATVASYAFAAMFSNLLFQVTRPVFKMQLKGLACVFEKSA
ncbi:MAG: flippase [bacterium]|nr:flippase [bacterium]